MVISFINVVEIVNSIDCLLAILCNNDKLYILYKCRCNNTYIIISNMLCINPFEVKGICFIKRTNYLFKKLFSALINTLILNVMLPKRAPFDYLNGNSSQS